MLRSICLTSAVCICLLQLQVVTAWAESLVEDKSSEKNASDEDVFERESLPQHSRFQLDGSVYTLFSWQNSSPDFGFSLERARLEVNWQISRKLISVVETALEDVTTNGTPDDLLRDAYIRYAPWSELQLTVGQFKKPFSIFELTPRAKMPVVHRGISNAYLVRDLGYGGRDIGFQVGGFFETPLKIHYAVGVFNGNGANLQESDGNGAKDFTGRIEVRTKQKLRAGLSLSWKNFDQTSPGNESKPISAWMMGLDVQLRISGIRLMAEGVYGVNHVATEHPQAAAFHALISWKFHVPYRQMFVMPVARLDGIWPLFSDTQEAHVYMGTGGIHWQIEKHLRVMLEYEITRSAKDLRNFWPDANCVLFQLALDW